MRDLLNKQEFVNHIMKYLQNRLEINNILRLRECTETLTIDEVYENYLEGIEKGYANNLDFRSNFHRTRNGEKVVFTEAQKEELYDLVRNYLLQTNISDYPDVRGDECKFITEILSNIYKDRNNVFDNMQEKIYKYIVALNSLRCYLSFYNDIEGFIVKNDKEFYFEDHKQKRFIECTLGSMDIGDFTPVVLNEHVYVVTLLNRDTQEEEKVFVVSQVNNSSFSEFSDRYQVLSAETLHHYLEANNCLFLERDLYDVEEINTSLKEHVYKYLSMSDEEKDRLDNLASVAANWWVIALETVNFCSPKDLNRALDSGYLNVPDLNIFESEEEAFRNILKDEIKALVLSKNPARISSVYLNSGVFKRAFNKSDFNLYPMYLHLKRENGEITYEDGDFKRVVLVPDFMSGFEDIFSRHDLLTSPLYKEMDIYNGNIFVNNAKGDKVLVYSTERDYTVLKRN